MAEAAGKVSQGSSIANVPLEDLTYEEAAQELKDSVNEWYATDVLVLESDYEKIEIPRSAFQFDIEGSIEKLEERTKRHWSNFFMKQKNVHLPLIVQTDTEATFTLPDYVDIEKTLANAISIAENLGEQTVQIEYSKDPADKQEVVAEASFPIPDISEAITDHLIGQLNGFVIPANESFSFIDSFNLLDGVRDTEEETSFIASGIYDLALQTNLEILERHSQGVIPSYTEAGVEAQVDYEADKDLILYNPNEYAYTIYAEKSDGVLFFTLKTISPKKNEEHYSIEYTAEIEPKTVYRYSPDLPYGTEQTIQAGSNGVQLEVHRTIEEENGDKEVVSTDFYPPQPTIVLQSTAEEPELPDEKVNDLGNLDLQGWMNDRLNGNGSENEANSEEENDNNDAGTESQPETGSEDMESSIEGLFSLCMLESQMETTGETVENDEKITSFCDLLGYYMLLGLFDSIEGIN